jgi:SAM-dependent methyltransferase
MNPPAFLASNFRKPSGILGIVAGALMKKRNFYVYPAIEEYCGFSKGMRVLEIGFGPGEGIGYYLGKHDIAMDGLDFSELMCKRAGKKYRGLIGSGRLSLMCADISAAKLAAGTYDRILFANVIYFIDDLRSFFSIIRESLRSGGKLVFYMSSGKRLATMKMTRNPLFIKYSLDQVIGALNACGFSQALAHPILDGSGDYLVVEAEKAAAKGDRS